MEKAWLTLLLLCCIVPCMSEELEQCFDQRPIGQAKQSEALGTPGVNTHTGAFSLVQLKRSVRPERVQPQLEHAIPQQLIMTGPYASAESLPQAVAENLRNTRNRNPEIALRYFSDAACGAYLNDHFGKEFREIYEDEPRGSFRGDICRSAILLREGGFYMDLDFQLHVPLSSLIDENTTLMTAWCNFETSGNTILNALMGVRPNSPVLKGVMKRLLLWYHGPRKRKGLLGPMVTAEALEEVTKNTCPQERSSVRAMEQYLAPEVSPSGEYLPPEAAKHKHRKPEQWNCGSENVRMYQEEYFGKGQSCLQEGRIVCPLKRAVSSLHGAGYGVFRVGDESRESRLIGWPRYLECIEDGCGITKNVGDTHADSEAALLEEHRNLSMIENGAGENTGCQHMLSGIDDDILRSALEHNTIPEIHSTALELQVLQQQRVFIAACLHQSQDVLPHWTAELIRLVLALKNNPLADSSIVSNLFVSIYESGSTDLTIVYLNKLREHLDFLGVPHEIVSGGNQVRRDRNRIEFLADIRNRALEPMLKASTPFDRVLYLNDIYYCADGALQMLQHSLPSSKGGLGADAVCGMDYIMYNDFEISESAKQCHFYDIWAATDMDGQIFMPNPPFTHATGSPVPNGNPFQVFSCWNGMVAFAADLFQQRVVSFRRNHDLLRECPASEATLLARDMWTSGRGKIVVTPTAASAYTRQTFENCALPLQPTAFNKVVDFAFHAPPDQVTCCPLEEHATYVDFNVCYIENWAESHIPVTREVPDLQDPAPSLDVPDPAASPAEQADQEKASKVPPAPATSSSHANPPPASTNGEPDKIEPTSTQVLRERRPALSSETLEKLRHDLEEERKKAWRSFSKEVAHSADPSVPSLTAHSSSRASSAVDSQTTALSNAIDELKQDMKRESDEKWKALHETIGLPSRGKQMID